MKKLITVLTLICMFFSFSCTAMAAEEDVIGTRAQYLSWSTARRAILQQGLEGSLMKIGDYDLMMWVPASMTPLDEMPGEDYTAYFKDETNSAEVGVQTIDMGEGITLESMKQLLTDQGFTDCGVYVVNGFYGIVFTNEETDNISIAFVSGDTEAVVFSFYPASDEAVMDLARIMISSIQPVNPTVSSLADMIDTDLLETVWGENRKVTFNEEDKSIYVVLWDEGINAGDFDSINNYDAVKQDKIDLAAFYMDTFKELGATDVHLIIQYGAESDDAVFFTIIDGELVYDCAAEGAAADTEAADTPAADAEAADAPAADEPAADGEA